MLSCGFRDKEQMVFFFFFFFGLLPCSYCWLRNSSQNKKDGLLTTQRHRQMGIKTNRNLKRKKNKNTFFHLCLCVHVRISCPHLLLILPSSPATHYLEDHVSPFDSSSVCRAFSSRSGVPFFKPQSHSYKLGLCLTTDLFSSPTSSHM